MNIIEEPLGSRRRDLLGDLLAGLAAGDRRALARLLTVVENGSPEQADRIAGHLHPRAGRARVIGVTGPPGAGKSSLTSALTRCLRRGGRTVAILAVDPSSPFTGGALLGDRIRMQEHHGDPGVYLRSMAGRGHLGGLCTAAARAITVLDAAGFDDVIVETVGVGQSEVEIAALARTTVVVLAPGMGDRIQAAKAGVLEIADVFVVNKADRPGADRLRSELLGMVRPGAPTGGPGSPRGWIPPVLGTVATTDGGIEELATALDEHDRHRSCCGTGPRQEREQGIARLREAAVDQVRRHLDRLDRGPDGLLSALAGRMTARELDPQRAADLLLRAIGADVVPDVPPPAPERGAPEEEAGCTR